MEDKAHVYLFLPLCGDLWRKEEMGKHQLTVYFTNPVGIMIMQRLWALK